MNISSIKAVLSWDDINQLITEMSHRIPISDLSVKYDRGIVISGRVKGGMPLSIYADYLGYNNEGIHVQITRVSVFVRMPDMLKRSFIKDYISKHIGDDKIIYKEEYDKLIFSREMLYSLLPFDSGEIKSIGVDEQGIAVELSNVKPGSGEAVKASKCEEGSDIEEIEYIIENDDVVTEDFDADKSLDYYDRLRLRIEGYIKSGMPKRLHYLIPYMLLLPDVLALLTRLFMDKRISAADKALVVAGITYIITSLDIIPDLILPFGAIDDLSIGFFVLDKLLLSVPEEILKENFSGSEDVVNFIKNGYSYIKNLVPSGKMDKILGLFNVIFKKVNKKQG